eukprot:579961-Prymnesium_polylepis.2
MEMPFGSMSSVGSGLAGSSIKDTCARAAAAQRGAKTIGEGRPEESHHARGRAALPCTGPARTRAARKGERLFPNTSRG